MSCPRFLVELLAAIENESRMIKHTGVCNMHERNRTLTRKLLYAREVKAQSLSIEYHSKYMVTYSLKIHHIWGSKRTLHHIF